MADCEHMKKAQVSLNPLQPFQAGQVWKMEDASLVIGQVGNLLIHYRCHKDKAKRGSSSFTRNSSLFTSKRELEKFLTDKKAVLVQE